MGTESLLSTAGRWGRGWGRVGVYRGGGHGRLFSPMLTPYKTTVRPRLPEHLGTH